MSIENTLCMRLVSYIYRFNSIWFQFNIYLVVVSICQKDLGNICKQFSEVDFFCKFLHPKSSTHPINTIITSKPQQAPVEELQSRIPAIKPHTSIISFHNEYANVLTLFWAPLQRIMASMLINCFAAQRIRTRNILLLFRICSLFLRNQVFN